MNEPARNIGYTFEQYVAYDEASEIKHEFLDGEVFAMSGATGPHSLLTTAMSKHASDRFADAGRMYEALLAFLYSQGRRFSAHDLGEFLGRFRSPEETGQHVILDAEGGTQQLPLQSKSDLAGVILDRVVALLHQKRAGS